MQWQDQALQGLLIGIISGALFAVLALQNKTLVNTWSEVRLGVMQQGIAVHGILFARWLIAEQPVANTIIGMLIIFFAVVANQLHNTRVKP